jgi:kumamolisin
MEKQQNRVELKSSARTEMAGARKIGPADPNERITVTVVLRRGSAPSAFPSVDKLGATAPMERHHLSREEFAAQHGASPDDISKVEAFAKEYGLQVAEESPERRSVFLSGTVEDFSKAFSVQLNRYQHAKGTFRCRTGTLQIPAELDGIIEGVFGLDNRPQATPHFRLFERSSGKSASAGSGGFAHSSCSGAGLRFSRGNGWDWANRRDRGTGRRI